MQSPLPTISLILLYLLFVRYAPRFMKDRPAFEMKTFLFFFNAAIVVFYVYLTREVRNILTNSHDVESMHWVTSLTIFGSMTSINSTI